MFYSLGETQKNLMGGQPPPPLYVRGLRMGVCDLVEG